jgi:hypothetical protein
MAKEYVPFEAYGLLRRIVDQGPQRVRNALVLLDNAAHYLISRGLATASAAGDRLENTEAGREVGLIDTPTV